MIVYLAVLTQYQRVTDTHTAGKQTHDDSIYRVIWASRGKNLKCIEILAENNPTMLKYS